MQRKASLTTIFELSYKSKLPPRNYLNRKLTIIPAFYIMMKKRRKVCIKNFQASQK